MSNEQGQLLATKWAWSYVDRDGIHSVVEFSPDGLIESMAAEFGTDPNPLCDKGDFVIYALRRLNIPQEIVEQYYREIDSDDAVDALENQYPDLEPWLIRTPFYADPPITSSDPHKAQYIVFGGLDQLGYGILVYDFPSLLHCLNMLRGLC